MSLICARDWSLREFSEGEKKTMKQTGEKKKQKGNKSCDVGTNSIPRAHYKKIMPYLIEYA